MPTDQAQAAYLWGVVRQKLIEAGCPIQDGCHVPTTIDEWLAGVRATRCFTAKGSIDPADVARQLEAAARAGDSSLCEVGALVIRRLLETK